MTYSRTLRIIPCLESKRLTTIGVSNREACRYERVYECLNVFACLCFIRKYVFCREVFIGVRRMPIYIKVEVLSVLKTVCIYRKY